MRRIASRFRQKRADPARDRPMGILRGVVMHIDASPSPVGHEDTEPFSENVGSAGWLWVVLKECWLFGAWHEVRQSVCSLPWGPWMLRFFKHLLYVWASKPLLSRR